MGPSDGNKDFVVDEPDPAIYNLTGADPPLWEPKPDDILQMFQQLQTEKVFPLKWVCHGRRAPSKEPLEQDLNMPSEDDDGGLDKMEKRAPEPSAFDFDDTASEGSARLVPRTPVSTKKRPEKRVARMDNVLSSIRRQQKAEREARRSQPRSQGASPFHGGTPPCMASFSPASSPVSRFAGSPRPGSAGSPRMSAPPESPTSRLGIHASSPSASHSGGSPLPARPGHSGSPPTPKSAGSPSNARSSGSPSAARGLGGGVHSTASPKGGGSPASAVPSSVTGVTISGASIPPVTVTTSASSEPSAGTVGATVAKESGGGDAIVNKGPETSSSVNTDAVSKS